MNDPFYHKLRETSWRRKLTPAELTELRAWLEKNPDARADWETEAGLNALLRELPDAPVASNFTARVLQTVEREDSAAPRRPASGKWAWRSLWPKVAFGAMALLAGLLAYRGTVIQKQLKLEQKARSVAAISEVSSLPGPDVLLNFEAVRQLNSRPSADPGLLAVFPYLQ